jgi:ParB-like chromosome segregation protein Spo0J
MGSKAMEVVSRNLDDLIPYINNARTHSDSQVAQIAASLIEFGWTNPILTNGNSGIAAGHGRLMAAKKIRDAGAKIPNWKDNSKAPTIDLAHLSKTQIKAYIIADNKLAENAGWDDELLKIEIEELKLEEFDLDKIGFTQDELDKFFPDVDEWREPGESQAREIDTNEFEMECRCPKCGFEFDPKS